MVAVLLLQSILPLLLFGATVPEMGDNAEYWDHRFVIFAQVMVAEKLDPREGPFTYLVTLQPKATLTGKFDPVLEPEIKVKVPVDSPLSSAIRKTPTVGANVIVVIRLYEGAYCVSYHKVAYMPEALALLEVKDFADPQVDEVLKNLRSLRAKKFPPTVPILPGGKLPFRK